MCIEEKIFEAYPHLLGTRRVNRAAKKWMLLAMILYLGSLVLLLADVEQPWQYEQNRREIERANLHLQNTDAKVEQLFLLHAAIDKQVSVIEWQMQAIRSVIGFVVSAVIANIVALFFLYLSKKSSIKNEDIQDLKHRLEQIEKNGQ